MDLGHPGSVQRSENALMGVSLVTLFPLTFLSNVFVDPATMLSGLQSAVELNPVTHLVEAMRGLMHSNLIAADLAMVAVISAVLIAVFGTLTMLLIRRTG